jgi:hypothetical protein
MCLMAYSDGGLGGRGHRRIRQLVRGLNDEEQVSVGRVVELYDEYLSELKREGLT